MNKFPGKNRRSPRVAVVAALGILGGLIFLSSVFNVVRYALTRFADGFFYPYMKITVPPEQPSGNVLMLQDKSVLANKVEKLTEINRTLALQSQAATELMEENRQLRNLLKLPDISRTKFITAGILLHDPLNFSDGFTIDKGSRDGIVPGAAVVQVNDDGKLLLVGVISETGARSSKVTTVAHASLRISGRVSANNEIGFTNTGNPAPNGRISFGMLPLRNDYVHGNAVFTTGFENGIPPGIRIGNLYTVNSGHSFDREDFNCELLLSVHFSSLRFVAVAVIPQQRITE